MTNLCRNLWKVPSVSSIFHDFTLTVSPKYASVFELASYLPDSLLPAYEDVKDTLVTWLSKLGIVRSSSDSSAADSSRARQALQDAENALRDMKNDRETKASTAAKIFEATGFGKKGEWKKLDGECFEKNTGE